MIIIGSPNALLEFTSQLFEGDPHQHLELLLRNLEENKIVTHIAKPREAMELLNALTRGKIVYAQDSFEVWSLNIKADYIPREKLRDLEVAVLSPSIIFADSGTILVFSDATTQAMLTIPKTLIFVAGIERVIPSLARSVDKISRLWRKFLQRGYNLNFFSNPSRTGDIEKKVVMGAHGPAEVILILLDWFDDLGCEAYKNFGFHLVPLAFPNAEEKMRSLGGTLSLIDLVARMNLVGDISDSAFDYARKFFGDNPVVDACLGR